MPKNVMFVFYYLSNIISIGLFTEQKKKQSYLVRSNHFVVRDNILFLNKDKAVPLLLEIIDNFFPAL